MMVRSGFVCSVRSNWWGSLEECGVDGYTVAGIAKVIKHHPNIGKVSNGISEIWT